MRKSFKYKLYPTKAQTERLEATLGACCELYNAAVQERRDAYRVTGHSPNCAEQQAQLPEIKQVREDLAQIHSQVLQETLRRVDRAFDGFFRRVKQGAKPGYPRFRSRSRYDSFTYPQSGFELEDGKLRLSKIGRLKIKLYRPIEGKIKTLTIKREAGCWYACLSVECEAKPLPARPVAVGIDVGLNAFATLSDGTEIENPRHYREAEAKLRRAQRKVARRKKGGHGRKKAVRELQRTHAHVCNQRADFHHKLARRLVVMFGLICVEDLNVKGLSAGMLAKSVNDAGWSAFITKLTHKAEEAGRVLVKVDPRGTSQRCLCGADVPKRLSQRWHECQVCGLSAARDHVSALEILRLGRSLIAPTWPTAACVAMEASPF